jgi:hypothetical protein
MTNGWLPTYGWIQEVLQFINTQIHTVLVHVHLFQNTGQEISNSKSNGQYILISINHKRQEMSYTVNRMVNKFSIKSNNHKCKCISSFSYLHCTYKKYTEKAFFPVRK